MGKRFGFDAFRRVLTSSEKCLCRIVINFRPSVRMYELVSDWTDFLEI